MKLFSRISALSMLAVLAIGIGHAQVNNLTQTSLSAAIANSTNQTFPIASATGVTVTPQTYLLVDQEAMLVTALSGTTVTVARGQFKTVATPHANSAMVLAGRPDWFVARAPSGACVTATSYTTPTIDLTTGAQWLCSTITLTWVPGFGNDLAQPQVTTAVASAAGLITPSGPLFHITGTSAITGFNVPVGFAFGSFCAIPDAIFTTTTANNVALASTAVVNKLLCWMWDNTNSKFVPSY